ncbi:MAG TPA: epoxide hydrolase [Burkholderiaceae bacterium]|nr:epoxide hydrolase [Burkholderiaceae bacterium]
MSDSNRFTIEIPSARIDRILERIRDYEWPREPADAGWSHGVPPGVIRALADRWLNGFDWRQQERRMNRFEHYKASLNGLELHFVHRRAGGSQPARAPLVLLHGWPTSFIEYLDIADRLAGAATGSGRDVVIVSLPGFGFSSAPSSFMGPRAIAGLVHLLMTRTLGCSRYIAHGSDWGAIVAGWLGFDQPQACAGIHMTMISPRFIAGAASEPAELQWLGGFRDRFEDDGAYFRLQTSRPLTFGYALNDTPVGLLGWIAEKWVAWSDPASRDRIEPFAEPAQADRLLTNVMLYLVTGTAATSGWIYRGLAQEGAPGYPGGGRVEVPVGFAATRDPIFVPPPRSLVEKAYRIVRWTEYAKGGHFPALDSPDELCADLEAFVSSL